MLRSKDDIELENDEKIASNQPISNDHETLKENISYSETVQEQISTDFELLKKLQVLQNMNPAIKALMNYRGILFNVFLKSWFIIMFILIS